MTHDASTSLTRVDRALQRNADTNTTPAIDPRALGMTRAAYSVGETLTLLSIGRTSFYALVNSGALPLAKLGRKTLVLSSDIAALLIRLREAAQS